MHDTGETSTPISAAAGDFLLRDDMTFLNHGSFGACPRPVFETYQRWQRMLEAQPVEFLGRRLPELLAEAHAPLAAYVGAQADDLVFVPNATHGMNIVAHALPLAPGDEVLGTDHEYGAVERTWRFICEQRGARYHAQPVPLPVTSAEDVVEQIWAGVTDRTRVLVVSHITSPTALTFPIAELCRRAAERGIITVVDGAHAPGHIELSLDTLGADFYTGNCHKWLCAPKGSGFLYARRDRQPLLQPLVVSWGWQAIKPGPSPFQDYFGWTGTADPSAYLSVPSAIEYQAQHDWPQVRIASHELVAQARRRIADLTGLPQISPDSDAWFGQMCAAPLPATEHVTAEAFQRELWETHRIEVPIVEWEGQRFVRVSIQAYNSPRDVDRLIEALAATLR